MNELRSARLRLRRWEDRDRAPFAALNADPAVMEFMPTLLDRAQSDALVEQIEAHFGAHGFGLWALEELGGAPFLGFVGLVRTSFAAPFAPCVELAWRLARSSWGKGFATEAARAVCDAAFGPLGLKALVSFTVPGNWRSRRVMERLGMRHSAGEDFDHPRLPLGHALRRHVLYRLDAPGGASAAGR